MRFRARERASAGPELTPAGRIVKLFLGGHVAARLGYVDGMDRAPLAAALVALALAPLPACSSSTSSSGSGHAGDPGDAPTTAAVAPPPSAAASSYASSAHTAAAPSAAPPRDALMAFKGAWNLEVRPNAKPKDEKFIAGIDAELLAGQNEYTVKEVRCRDAAATIRRIGEQAKHDFVLFGSIAAAEREGPCWSVFYSGGMKKEVEGILSPSEMKTLVVWRIPEG